MEKTGHSLENTAWDPAKLEKTDHILDNNPGDPAGLEKSDYVFWRLCLEPAKIIFHFCCSPTDRKSQSLSLIVEENLDLFPTVVEPIQKLGFFSVFKPLKHFPSLADSDVSRFTRYRLPHQGNRKKKSSNYRSYLFVSIYEVGNS